MLTKGRKILTSPPVALRKRGALPLALGSATLTQRDGRTRRAAREGGVAFRSVLRYQLPDPDRVPLAPSYHQILSLGGFEPPTFTLSVYCSTTEL